MDGGEGSGAGTLLLLGVAGTGRAAGAGENAAGGEEEDVAVRELLLELTSQAVGREYQHLCPGIRTWDRNVQLTAAELGGSREGKGRGQR